jgi:hypothetical protein
MLTAILADHRHFHSTWQIDHAITGRSGGTLYGCYRQSVRELHKRWRGLRETYAQRERGKLDLDDLERAEPSTGNDARRREIDIAEKRLGLIELDGVIRDTEREFLRFYGQALACRLALGIGEGDTLDDARREALESEFWEHQIRCMAAVDYITTGRLGRGTVELFQCCPAEQRQRLAADLLIADSHPKLIEWYLSVDPALPQPIEFELPQAREVLSCVSRLSLPLLPNGTAEDVPYNREPNSSHGWKPARLAAGELD